MLGNALQYLVGIAAAVAVLVHDMVARVGVKAYAQGAPGRVIAARRAGRHGKAQQRGQQHTGKQQAADRAPQSGEVLLFIIHGRGTPVSCAAAETPHIVFCRADLQGGALQFADCRQHFLVGSKDGRPKALIFQRLGAAHGVAQGRGSLVQAVHP